MDGGQAVTQTEGLRDARLIINSNYMYESAFLAAAQAMQQH